jgi:protease I
MGEKASDMELMAETVQDYFDGLYHSDVEKLKSAFHPQAAVVGYFQGQFLFNTFEGFLEFVASTPAPSKSGEAYDMRIVSMDLMDTAGVVKVADLYLGLRFTDYLSMAKIDGRWVIINKNFYHEPKA